PILGSGAIEELPATVPIATLDVQAKALAAAEQEQTPLLAGVGVPKERRDGFEELRAQGDQILGRVDQSLLEPRAFDRNPDCGERRSEPADEALVFRAREPLRRNRLSGRGGDALDREDEGEQCCSQRGPGARRGTRDTGGRVGHARRIL